MCPSEDPALVGDDGRSLLVLLVEDEVLLRLAVADALRGRGFTVVEAANGDEARDLILAGVAADLVMSDLAMPGTLDGAGLALWLRDNGVAAPIILTSGLAQALSQARESCPHVTAFMPKPYDHGDLVARIEGLLAARRA